MKNTNLPSKKEWDNIIDEAFSSKQEHIFSAGYEAKKDAMMRGITMKRKNVDKKSYGTDRRLVLSVAAAAALFAIVPAGIFIADHKGNGTTAPMTNMSDAEQETSISEEEQRKLEEEQRKIEEENRKLQEEISRQQEELKKLDRSAIEPMQLEFTYVPEGLVYNEDGPYGGKYKSETGGGMSKELYVAEEDAEFTTYNFRWDSEEYDLDGKHVIIRYARSITDDVNDENTYSRFVFVKFNDTPYVGILHITDNYSDEEVRKVCEGMSLVPCDKLTAQTWEDQNPDNEYKENKQDNKFDSLLETYAEVDMSRINLYHIGDTFTNEWMKSLPDTEKTGVCDITLNDAWIQDNFDGITTDTCGWWRDYSEFTDENGNIIPNTRTWYSATQNGDPHGIIDQREVNKRIVVLELTYTNNYDVETECCVCPEMFDIRNNSLALAGGYARNGADEVMDFIWEAGLRYDSDGFISFDSDKKKSNNYVVLAPGESTHVQLAFMVDDASVGHLYYGAYPANTSDASKNYYDSPIVDLTEIREQ
ncbi:MAG: hypothetical protein K5979_13825 [Ruminococcus sp.]|nr:hypothetical protein [Ruminococcus sp.]